MYSFICAISQQEFKVKISKTLLLMSWVSILFCLYCSLMLWVLFWVMFYWGVGRHLRLYLEAINLMRWIGCFVWQPCELGFLRNHMGSWFMLRIGLIFENEFLPFWERFWHMWKLMVLVLKFFKLICTLCLLNANCLINCLYELWGWISRLHCDDCYLRLWIAFLVVNVC